jgi:hypothetical protein
MCKLIGNLRSESERCNLGSPAAIHPRRAHTVDVARGSNRIETGVHVVPECVFKLEWNMQPGPL